MSEAQRFALKQQRLHSIFLLQSKTWELCFCSDVYTGYAPERQ